MKKQIPDFVVIEPNSLQFISKQTIARGLVELFTCVLYQYLFSNATYLKQISNAHLLLGCLIALGKSFNNQDDLWRVNFLWVANQAKGNYLSSKLGRNWAMRLMECQGIAPNNDSCAAVIDEIEHHVFHKPSNRLAAKLQLIGREVFGFNKNDRIVDITLASIKEFYQQLDNEAQSDHGRFNHNLKMNDVRSLLKSYGMKHLDGEDSMTLKQGEMLLKQMMALRKLRLA